MSAVIATAIRLAWPDSRAKRIANALGCSVITGKRIASTGYASGRFRSALLRLLDVEIEKNEARLRALREELRNLEAAEMLDRAAARRADAVDAAPEMASSDG